MSRRLGRTVNGQALALTNKSFAASLVVAGCVLVAGFGVASPSLAQEVDEEPISWLATGDSYSSGEGVAGNRGACAQSNDAYGPAASQAFSGASIEILTFTACTGHLASDFFGVRAGKQESLWEWGQEIAPGQSYDIVTMTFGGNDIEFSSIIKDCLIVLPSSWADLVGWAVDDCEITQDTIERRIDSLVGDAERFQVHPTDDTQKGSLAEFYRAVADNELTPSGQLYVLGYPKLFAPSAEWGLFQGTRCNGITRGDANMLGEAARYLDEKLSAAVEDADAGEGRIVYIPVVGLFTHHELCGNGEDWINGSITFERDVTSAGFHPKAVGHDAEANYLLNWVESPQYGVLARRAEYSTLVQQPWTLTELGGASIPSVCGHPPTTLVNGEHLEIQENFGVLHLRPELANGGPSWIELPESAEPGLSAVVARCHAGGTGWPDPILFFRGGEFYDSTFLDDYDWASIGLSRQARSGVLGISNEDGRLIVDLAMYAEGEGGCCWSGKATVAVEARDGQVLITEVVSYDTDITEPDETDVIGPEGCGTRALRAHLGTDRFDIVICGEPGSATYFGSNRETGDSILLSVCPIDDFTWVSTNNGFRYEVDMWVDGAPSLRIYDPEGALILEEYARSLNGTLDYSYPLGAEGVFCT